MGRGEGLRGGGGGWLVLFYANAGAIVGKNNLNLVLWTRLKSIFAPKRYQFLSYFLNTLESTAITLTTVWTKATSGMQSREKITFAAKPRRRVNLPPSYFARGFTAKICTP